MYKYSDKDQKLIDESERLMREYDDMLIKSLTPKSRGSFTPDVDPIKLQRAFLDDVGRGIMIKRHVDLLSTMTPIMVIPVTN